MTVSLLAMMLPLVGFVLTLTAGWALGLAWSRRLALLLTALAPLGLGVAMMNRTYESGMLGALGAVAAGMACTGAWAAQLWLLWRSRRQGAETEGPGLSRNRE